MSIISHKNKEIAEQKKCTFSALQSGFTRSVENGIVALVRNFVRRITDRGAISKLLSRNSPFATKRTMPFFTAGFTFIELVVVISIVSIISSVLIFNYGSFDANIRLQNLAQDIALRIKEAQTVAISGTYANDYSYDFQYGASGDPAGQAPSYGVYFDVIDNPPIVSGVPHDKIFAFFADRPFKYAPTPLYEASAIDHILTPPPSRGDLCDPGEVGQPYAECLSVTQITSLDHISGISYKEDDGTIASVPDNIGITFTRPWPGAQFANLSNTLPSDIQEVYIEIQSLRDLKKHKYVLVNRTGQISVKDGCAPVSGSPDSTCIVTP